MKIRREDFQGKIIETIIADTVNVVRFIFTDGSYIELEVEHLGRGVHGIVQTTKVNSVPSTVDGLSMLLSGYYEELKATQVSAIQFFGAGRFPDPSQIAAHLRWMCRESLQTHALRETAKRMRWLGFIQGALWAARGVSIDTLQEQTTRMFEGRME